VTEPKSVTFVRWLMITSAIVLSPLYGLWIAGGAICDAREKAKPSRRIQAR
jgi:hypothetical protein